MNDIVFQSENILHCDLAARNLLVEKKGERKFIIKVKGKQNDICSNNFAAV